MNRITVVIPSRMSENPDVTLDSLKESTFQDFKTVVVYDQGKGANWARNEGFKQCDTEYVIFSDNDIKWKSRALETLVKYLDMFPKISYAYGRYLVGTTVWGHAVYSPQMLRIANFVSTMSLIRTKDFPGFDESLLRFQDWDLFLTMLEQGKHGMYVDDLLFTTDYREGISSGAQIDDNSAALIIDQKHKLNLERFKKGYL